MLFGAERPKFLMSKRKRVLEISVERRRASGHFFTALIFLVHFWIKPKMHIPLRKEARRKQHRTAVILIIPQKIPPLEMTAFY
jgi:hypothetical protein